MKYIVITLLLGLFIGQSAFGQDLYFTKTGHIHFMSRTDAINIDGNNNQVTSFLNTTNGEMVFQLLVKSFKFTLATAEEHFNDTYMESDKFPKSSFKGNITNLTDIDFSKNGTYKAIVKGDLTIHGVTKPIIQEGKITISEGKMNAESTFILNIKDFNIKVPKMVEDRVAKSVDVKVNMEYLPYKK
jgi:polyisoprenoid-binding protein YceI